jgi:hypothetical protein
MSEYNTPQDAQEFKAGSEKPPKREPKKKDISNERPITVLPGEPDKLVFDFGTHTATGNAEWIQEHKVAEVIEKPRNGTKNSEKQSAKTAQENDSSGEETTQNTTTQSEASEKKPQKKRSSEKSKEEKTEGKKKSEEIFGKRVKVEKNSKIDEVGERTDEVIIVPRPGARVGDDESEKIMALVPPAKRTNMQFRAVQRNDGGLTITAREKRAHKRTSDGQLVKEVTSLIVTKDQVRKIIESGTYLPDEIEETHEELDIPTQIVAPSSETPTDTAAIEPHDTSDLLEELPIERPEKEEQPQSRTITEVPSVVQDTQTTSNESAAQPIPEEQQRISEELPEPQSEDDLEIIPEREQVLPSERKEAKRKTRNLLPIALGLAGITLIGIGISAGIIRDRNAGMIPQATADTHRIVDTRFTPTPSSLPNFTPTPTPPITPTATPDQGSTKGSSGETGGSSEQGSNPENQTTDYEVHDNDSYWSVADSLIEQDTGIQDPTNTEVNAIKSLELYLNGDENAPHFLTPNQHIKVPNKQLVQLAVQCADYTTTKNTPPDIQQLCTDVSKFSTNVTPDTNQGLQKGGVSGYIRNFLDGARNLFGRNHNTRNNIQ